MLAGASDKPWLEQFAIYIYMGADKPYLITKLSMQKLPELLCIVFLLGVLVVWKLSPSESCLSISCRCSLPHISMLASWLGAFAPISMQMSGLPEASRTWNFPFCSEDRFQNLSQQEPFEVISLVHAVWSLKHPYGPNVETWNITKSGRMFGVWCRLFRVNSKGIYTLHTRTCIYTYKHTHPPSRSTFLLWIPGVKNKQTYTKTKGKKHTLREMSHLEFPQSLLCSFSPFLCLCIASIWLRLPILPKKSETCLFQKVFGITFLFFLNKAML